MIFYDCACIPFDFCSMFLNLHYQISFVQELFSAIAPIKSARMVRRGVAEIVYNTHQDAANAHKKYHTRNLDGKSKTTCLGNQLLQSLLLLVVLLSTFFRHKTTGSTGGHNPHIKDVA